MIIKTNIGNLDTLSVSENIKKSMDNLESSIRNTPNEAYKVTVGIVIPLGTLGGASDEAEQFRSNFQVVAYNCPELLQKNHKDLVDFNVNNPKIDNGGLIKNLLKELNKLAEEYLGPGWRITIFNAPLPAVLKSMGQGVSTPEALTKNSTKLIDIVATRLIKMKKTYSEITDKTEVYEHEIIELFYGGHSAMSLSLKGIDNSKEHKVKDRDILDESDDQSSKIMIQMLVFDRWANGLRSLKNIESFTSTKIRMYDTNDVNAVAYAFSLKARLVGDNVEAKPIRGFDGTTILSKTRIKSGCTRRIIYNLVNKNYSHWSYLAIPSNSKLEVE